MSRHSDEYSSQPELPPINDNSDLMESRGYSPSNTHVKTYTAGEDHGRLAAMAKQFGLENQREPRKNVRSTGSKNNRARYAKTIDLLVNDHMVEDARMLAVWSSNRDMEEDDFAEEQLLYNRLHSWDEGEMPTLEEGGEEEEGAEVDPHAEGLGSDLTAAVIGIIKGMVGPAILYLPHGFANAGYAVALPIMAFSVATFIYSSDCLSKSWQIESAKEELKLEQMPLVGSQHETYGGKAVQISKKSSHKAMLSYPELAYRSLGARGESILKVGISLLQSGVCLTYLIFVPQNLHTSMQLLFGWNITPDYWLILMIIVQIPLSWIRDIRKLTLTNLLSMILITFGLITCMGFALSLATSDPTKGPVEEVLHRFANLAPYRSGWLLFVGTGLFMFEGSITLMVPLQEAVQGKAARAKFPKVYNITVFSVTFFYAIFALFCWMGFGDGVRTVLTVSLPVGNIATAVQLCYSIAVVLTFPLQNFPALEITCRSVVATLRPCSGGRKVWWTSRNFWSSIFVCLLAIVAILAMESLDKVVSLMGSLMGCPIVMVFPPLIHLGLDPNMSPTRKFGNYLVAIIGVVCMVVASYITAITWNDVPEER